MLPRFSSPRTDSPFPRELARRLHSHAPRQPRFHGFLRFLKPCFLPFIKRRIPGYFRFLTRDAAGKLSLIFPAQNRGSHDARELHRSRQKMCALIGQVSITPEHLAKESGKALLRDFDMLR